ncbi:hypothetical protein B296_00032710 [Ensete ventricosum]|uniref:Uncharacterized protein n=1 Tax=Ensete ventricosum TaxID=4639 RepID=A0A426ZB73_ENSVE|nr:hypothetical protein B296_00032710 [Ensete ventricosum]
MDDVVGARQAFARTSPKVSGRSLGRCREIAGGRPSYSLLEKLEVFSVGKPLVSNRKTVAAQVSWRLTAGKSPVP